MTDTPENLDYGSVARATALAYGVAARLAERPPTGGHARLEAPAHPSG